MVLEIILPAVEKNKASPDQYTTFFLYEQNHLHRVGKEKAKDVSYCKALQLSKPTTYLALVLKIIFGEQVTRTASWYEAARNQIASTATLLTLFQCSSLVQWLYFSTVAYFPPKP